MKKIFEHLKTDWYKYLMEVLVITFGILGAFALNNWNENHKSGIKEKSLLLNLKRDFSLRQQELLEFKDTRKKADVAISYLNRAIADQQNPRPKANLDSCIVHISNAMSFNDQFKMLDVLFTTGMINDLQSESLKQHLLIWPQQVEEMMEEQRTRLSLHEKYFEPLLMKHIAVREIWELVSFRGYGLPSGRSVTYPSDYAALLKDPTFERYLANLESLLVVNEIDSDILIASAAKILHEIDKEVMQ